MAMIRHTADFAALRLSMSTINALLQHLEAYLSVLGEEPHIGESYVLGIQSFCLPHWHKDPSFPRVFAMAMVRCRTVQSILFFPNNLPDDALGYHLPIGTMTPPFASSMSPLTRLMELRPDALNKMTPNPKRWMRRLWSRLPNPPRRLLGDYDPGPAA